MQILKVNKTLGRMSITFYFVHQVLLNNNEADKNCCLIPTSSVIGPIEKCINEKNLVTSNLFLFNSNLDQFPV